MGSTVKSTHVLSEDWLGSEHHMIAQKLSITPILDDSIPFSTLCEHLCTCDEFTYMKAKYT